MVFPFRLLGVPVLLYHGLSGSSVHGNDSRDKKYILPASHLQAHLAHIKDLGYRVVLLNEFWPEPRRRNDQVKHVVVTFDDGLVSDYQEAYPILTEAGVQANFFVNTATIGTRGFLTWQQIAEMQRAGMSFQSHGHDHVVLIRLSTGALEQQLSKSKQLLEDRVGRPVDFLAVPYGFVNRRIKEIAGQVGYRAVCTSRNWPARSAAETVSRVAIYGHTPPDEFRDLLAGAVLPYAVRAARTALLQPPKRVLLRLRPESLGVRVLQEPV